jgi:hypothetical protein
VIVCVPAADVRVVVMVKDDVGVFECVNVAVCVDVHVDEGEGVNVMEGVSEGVKEVV